MVSSGRRSGVMYPVDTFLTVVGSHHPLVRPHAVPGV